MIPTKLQISNFLSYRETAVLSFTGLHLACISGANGAGKSSILDSITWALFGQSRSRSDDDLVNRLSVLDDKGAEVSLEFELEGTLYKVTRSKRKGKTTQLDLQIGGENGWKTLTEGKLRDTQAAIESLLRMNYDTFINASFLLQGKADEFTTKTPNRRKEILADLLGVSVWEQYRELAASRRKEEEGKLDFLDHQIKEIDLELEQEAARQTAVAEAQSSLETITERLNDKEKLLQQLRRVETAVKQHKQLVQTLATNLNRAKAQLESLQRSQTQRQQERDGYATILDEAEEITAQYQSWQEADALFQSWQARADEFNQLEQKKRPYDLTIAEQKSRLTQQLEALQTQASRAAAAADEQQKLEEALTSAKAALAALETRLEALSIQEAEWHQLRNTLQKRESEREAQTRELNRLQNWAKRMAGLREEETAVAQNAQIAQQQISQLTAQLTDLGEKEQAHNSALVEKAGLENSKETLREQMNRLQERINKLEAETGSRCPFCGQELTADHRAKVVAELRSEGGGMGDQFRSNTQAIETLTRQITEMGRSLGQRPQLEKSLQTQQTRQAQAQARLDEISQQLAEWEAGEASRLAELEVALATDDLAELRARVVGLGTAVQAKPALETERRQLEQRLANDEARLAELNRFMTDWAESGQETLATVQQQLENDDFAAEARVALAELAAKLAELDYDADAHAQARTARQALAEVPEKYQLLRQAEAAVKPLEDALAEGSQRVAEQEGALAELTQQQETAVAELAQMEADCGDLRGVENEAFALREEQIEANQKVAVAQNRLEVLGDQRQRKAELGENRTAVTQQIQRLKLLEKACGKSGVQALLIEQALPEIEERANELLDRLTGGEMTVTFATQRELKSRDGLAETLDIRIRDHAGERPYDNYSGGEQFRVNFAIRLALSQLLAKRAGARLQTLVIDEGFGSQDPNGRQRLVEAINTIQDDFKRILIITHIDELRDAFPNRIEVVKTAVGSRIEIV
ncbi:MAG: SMC family ATPase [Ardenticatenaceae bacterium]|nr:SMC family ATPase [Anaerolineales bacterium]MCB8941478.1 SMC family ATPase [Ardenticatenaceae bacterium]MCB8974628.1 SMC family ATPase [Ardenticatenaceae bacterium]